MGSVESLKNVASIIEANFRNQTPQVVVCSAMGGVTDTLLEIETLAEKGEVEEALNILEEVKEKHLKVAAYFGIEKDFHAETDTSWEDLKSFTRGLCMIHEVSDRSLAFLLSFGEKLSTRLLAEILKSRGMPARQFDSTFIKTQDENYAESEIDWKKTKKNVQEVLSPYIKEREIPVVTGFFGTNTKNIISLFGRGGSDFTGAILAVCLNNPTYEVWTDVDGFLNADPKIVKNARIIPEIGFEEASELCFFGAKILHPNTIRPVIEAGGNVYIRNTFNPQLSGTKISKSIAKSCPSVQAITSKKVVLLLFDIFASPKKKRQIFAELFSLAYERNACIDAIAASEESISFCVEEKYLKNGIFLRGLKKIAPLRITHDRQIICIVATVEIRGKVGAGSSFLGAISDAGVNIEMYSQPSSEITQLAVVEAKDAKKAILSVHGKMMGECLV